MQPQQQTNKSIGNAQATSVTTVPAGATVVASTANTPGESISSSTVQSLTAPPLPPRKASPNVADSSAVNRMLKPQTTTTSVAGASSLVNLANNTNLSALLSKSSENITSCEFEVPKTTAPPVPKHNVVMKSFSDEIDEISLRHCSLLENMDQESCDKVIVGPAETISGIIDTRPLETRKPTAQGTTMMNLTSTSSNSNSSSSNAIDGKEQKLVASNCANNLYHLKVNMQQQNQMRHQSYPNHMQSSLQSACNQQPSKSQTTPHLGMEYVKLCTASSSAPPVSSTASTASVTPGQQNRAHSTTTANHANGTRNVSNNHSKRSQHVHS